MAKARKPKRRNRINKKNKIQATKRIQETHQIIKKLQMQSQDAK
jgi:hypothetical protein